MAGAWLPCRKAVGIRIYAFHHFGYLGFIETPEAIKSECPIKLYCGV